MSSPFEQARTALLYGERLVAAGRHNTELAPLTEAVDGLEHLGAESWAGRARALIVAAGGTPPPTRVSLSDRLAPLELEVALAAVRMQLASAAIKLGLESPGELAVLLSEPRRAVP